MKVLIITALLVGFSLANSHEFYGVGSRKLKISDKQFLQRQMSIFSLFRNIHQFSFYKDHQDISKTYSCENNRDSYKKPEVVDEFMKIYNEGMLPRGEIFSILHHVHLKQAIKLFKVFYYAKDWDTLYKTAVWARNHVNEGIFVYAFSVAIVHRDDTFGHILPPIYEVFPHYFFPTEVIEKAHAFKQYYQGQDQKTYIIHSNYSGYYLNLNEEQGISYYLEDIGINAYYYYCNIWYPFWLGGDEFDMKKDRRGEQYYYLYSHLLARYSLERLSNDYGEIPFFDYDDTFYMVGYYPSLVYHNGLEFPQRPNYARLSDYFYNYGQSWSLKSPYGYSRMLVKDYERRIRDVIDAGVVFTKEGKMINILEDKHGFNILGNVIESNGDSVNNRYYGPLEIYLKHLLGYSYHPLHPYKLAPSALEHFETAMRDPAFYSLYKRILLLFMKYKVQLKPYTYDELNYNGVKVEKIDLEKLFTYFDYFDSDITNAIYMTADEFEKQPFKIKVRQQRLNHKPFTYSIYVNADKPCDAVVRVFIGPKYDEWNREYIMNDKRFRFVEMDVFRTSLQTGKNIIKRNSRETFWYVPDRTSYRELYKRILGAIELNEELQIDASEAFYGFPNRFILPIGRYGGQTFQVYVIVNEYKTPVAQQNQQKGDYYFGKVGSGFNYVDDYAFGFPFDRIIDEKSFHVPNSIFTDVIIYHKDDINTSHS